MTAKDDRKDDTDLDPGAYVGRLPERQAETIPGGLTDADERVAAHSTQSGPAAAIHSRTGTARARRPRMTRCVKPGRTADRGLIHARTLD
jgi:hypothetical protein